MKLKKIMDGLLLSFLLISLLLITVIFLITGCVDYKSENTKVYMSKDDWLMKDYRLNNLPKEASYIGCDEEGYYYYCIEAPDEAPDQQSSCIQIYYCTLEGGNSELGIIKDVNYWNISMNNEKIIISISQNDEARILCLEKGGTMKEVFRQKDYRLPYIYAMSDYLLVVSEENSQNAINRSLVRINLSTGNKQVIHSTQAKVDENGRITGERLIAAGGNEQDIFFSVDSIQGKNLDSAVDCTVYRYSLREDKVISIMPVERQIEFITGKEDIIIYSEYEAEYPLEESGKIARIGQKSIKEICNIPLVSCTNIIRDAVVEGERIAFRTPNAGYVMNTNTNKLFVYHFAEQIPLNYSSVNKNGFSYLYEKGDEIYLRTISLKDLVK